MATRSYQSQLLDLEISQGDSLPKPRGARIASLLLVTIFGTGTAIVLARYAKLQDPSPLSFFFILLAAQLLATSIHEIGHAFAVKLVNWKLNFLSFAGFSARLVRYRWKYSYNFKTLLQGSIGFTPTVLTRYRRKLQVVVLGGPFANLLTSGLAFLAMPYLQGLWIVMLGALGSLSLLMGFLNLLPFKIGNAEWDGFQAFRTAEFSMPSFAATMVPSPVARSMRTTSKTASGA